MMIHATVIDRRHVHRSDPYLSQVSTGKRHNVRLAPLTDRDVLVRDFRRAYANAQAFAGVPLCLDCARILCVEVR